MKSKPYLPYILAGAAGSLVTAFLPLVINSSQAEPKLLPFQGRLTDAGGNAIADGAKVVEFKMYDAPTGGNVKWAGEVHKLSVNGGLVNTMLGSKAGLGSVDFAAPSFLQITVDANGDGAITAADPPLLPRQSVVAAVYAAVAGGMQYRVDAATVATKGWEAVFDNGRPDTGKIGTNKLSADNGVTKDQIAPAAVETSELADNAVTLAKMADKSVGTAELIGTIAGGVETVMGAVTSEKIADGTIQPRDLSSGLQTSLVLPGTIVPFAGATVPANSGWLLCDGHEEPIADFPALAGVIGTAYGTSVLNPAGTHFKLPDFRGTFLRGVDSLPDFTLLPAAVNVTSNAITLPNHGFSRSTFPVQLSNTGGGLPAPLAINITYFLIVVDASTVKLAVSEANALANTPIDITGQGTGTHKVVSWMDPDKAMRGRMANGGNIAGLVGSVQWDEFKKHSHRLGNRIPGPLATGASGGDAGWNRFANINPNGTGEFDSSITGGNETRPKNAYVNYLIKY